jgi:beta-glucanase (GH16 family)
MRKVVYGFILLGISLIISVVPLVRAQEEADSRLLADFENGVPFMVDEFNNGLGLVTWGDAFENVWLSARQLVPFSALAIPGTEEQANTVLAVGMDINGWGGFTYVLNDGENWISEDWTAYNAIRFWFYGSGTGGQVQIDLFDNRNPDLTGDSAERWYYRIDDDVVGWRQFTIPFALFQRRTDFQPGGAPDDGLGLDQVSGFAFGFPAGAGVQIAYLDNIEVVVADDTEAVTIIGATDEEDDETVSEVDTVTWDSRTWNLIWSDEFEGEAGTPINPENWTCEVGGQGWGNQEHEYYTPRVENVSLNGEGSLAITAIQETLPGSRCWYGTCQYTSARCITQDKVEFTYGRVEARIKVPFGQGIWPAFWMLGANFREVGWPNSGEIDIMEHIGKEPYNIYGTVHGPSYSGGSGIGGSITLPEPVSDDFHVFAIDWDPDAIRWYVDGELYHKFTPDDLGNRRWVFDHDFFLLLNVAVGGLWPGYPDETTTFPQVMEVDYVRVYELVE